MPTIVEYTKSRQPMNEYPQRIVSPPHSGPCCFSDMQEIGRAEREGHWEFRYRRCQTCGFTVRVILRQIPDQALIDDLRRQLANSFVRNVPDY